MALNPVAFYFTSVYAESLFLMLSILCLYNIRNKKWIIAGIFGGLCSATRNIGVVLVLPVIVEYIFTMLPSTIFEKGKSVEQRLRVIKSEFNVSNIKVYMSSLWVFIIPSGLFIYMLYLYCKFRNAFIFIFAQSDYGRSTLNPIISMVVGMWTTLKIAICREDIRLQFYYFIEFIAVLSFVFLSVLCFRKLRFSYWILMVISLIIPLTKPALTNTVTDYFVSFPRYMMVCFPLMLCLYLVTQRNKLIYSLLITISTILLQINVYFWCLKYWVA